ncbi:hypothetical protein JXQ70_05405 [bacterium]|nr:hypothetical protein [bacterium]
MQSEYSENLTRLQELINTDHTTGAQALTIKIGQLLADIMRNLPGDMPLNEAHELILKTCRHIVRVQSALAPLKQMMKLLILQLEEARDLDDMKERALSFIDNHLDSLHEIKKRIVQYTMPLLVNKKRILTHSLSTLVFETLRQAIMSQCTFEVFATESRPVYEGRILSQQLSTFGVPVTFLVDAAAPAYVEQSDIVLLGADRITRSEIINKIGSLAIVLAAYASNKPCYILAGSDKFLAEEVEPVRLDSGSEGEVWADAPAGVHVINPYFERIPFRFVTAIITEQGIIPYGQIANHLDLFHLTS